MNIVILINFAIVIALLLELNSKFESWLKIWKGIYDVLDSRKEETGRYDNDN